MYCRLDGVCGSIIGTLNIIPTKSLDDYQTFTSEVKHAIGVHDLYICFSNASGETHLDWWKFNK